ncbi:MAG: hydroxymethylbilane synthase [Armatimonadetes bacterium]|nr:hydroxymethylbilane synthase [Armatimonadota bacterium]NIM23430.1 hydroxymethylbilane synthase [Armatimonadota bacterium]NIM67295.1 hydroxymethylbilane synthase [Armatimonadota bacterium]NIM75793.1 hydroxymethylbilane synthase [Armatimonadota bacterium]NIN05481.1 hydroxymethylbilane synthase [Armatimonadota bacterium]
MSEADRIKITIGTRGSQLARAQTEEVAACLREVGAVPEIKTIRTSGDTHTGPLAAAGVGVFVREIERALLEGEIDLAVHSMKDLPTGEREGLMVAAVPERVDPRDALVSRNDIGLPDLPPGSRVGTSSPRRVAQLRAYRPDLVLVPVRGNLDTRLKKLSGGEFDALIVACAGLIRMGLEHRATERISFDICLPAPGQGALALQVRKNDEGLCKLLSRFDHPPTRLAAAAERAFLARLGAGCSMPAGALGIIEGDHLVLQGVVADLEGKLVIRRRAEGSSEEGEKLGRELAQEVLAQGADRILEGCR